MAGIKRLVLASSNRGKLTELSELFAPMAVRLVAQADLGIEGAAETATTFVENALAKARHAAACSGDTAIGDDSGLVVDALRGSPGIRSARYAGPRATDAENNRKLIGALEPIAPPHRAAFHCVLVLLRHPTDPAPLIAGGIWRGEIIVAARGTGGFGYDPHFYVPELGRTAAELSSEEKHRYSHRGQAARALLDQYRLHFPVG